MDKNQINEMIAAFYRSSISKGDLDSLSYEEKNRWRYFNYGSSAPPIPKIHKLPDGFEEMYQSIMTKLATCNFHGMQDAVKTVFNISPDDESFATACIALLNAEADMYKARIDLIKGDTQPYMALLRRYEEIKPLPNPNGAKQSEGIHPTPRGVTLSEAIKKYSEDKIAKKDWGTKTVYENGKNFNLILNVVEDIEMSRFDDGEFAREIRKRFIKLPKNMSKYDRYDGKTIHEIMNMSGVACLSDARVNKYLEYLSALVKYSIKQRWCNINHFEDLRINNKKVKASEERDQYSQQDIERLLLGLQKCYNKSEPEKLWIPLLMLFLGCRPADIIRITRDKFTIIDRILSVHLKSKTDAGSRTVPLHPFLLECGFEKFLSTIKDSGNLWSDNLKFYEQKNADTHERWYNRTFEPKFVTDEPKKSLYSIRHSFITNLKHAKVDRFILKEIVGHEKDLPEDDITFDRYGKEYPVAVKLEEMKKLDYDVDLENFKIFMNSIKW